MRKEQPNRTAIFLSLKNRLRIIGPDEIHNPRSTRQPVKAGVLGYWIVKTKIRLQVISSVSPLIAKHIGGEL